MPVTGPSHAASVVKADQITADFLEFLKIKHGVFRPLIGHVEWKGHWDEGAEKLKNAVRDLVWTSDAASF